MKKIYSLALWWWAAIWFVHIWVIKYIEENDIEVTEISWTSMWAIVASFYAIWKTSEFMEEFVKKVNFLKLLDFDLRNWLLKWDKIYKLLKTIFKDIKIEDLDIKLKIVATNIETWEKKIFSKWSILEAVRASISLPGIFKPCKIWNNHFVDWWILNNLPIEVLEWKNIIAVSAIKNITWELTRKRKVLWMNLKVWFLNINYQILQRSLLFMMKENETNSIKTFWKKIILIKPDTKRVNFYSFDKVDLLINRWYKEANNILNK